MKRIIVAVDGSEGANRAGRFAAQLAHDTGAVLTLLHVYNTTTTVALGLESLTHDEVEKNKTYVAKGSFDAARHAIGSMPVTIETHVAIGYPGHEIVTYAQTSKADVVVMGSRGRSPVATLLLGSVSDYVVRHATCPVTIVR